LSGINILAGVSSVPLTSERKGPTPIGSTWRRAVLSADAGLLVLVSIQWPGVYGAVKLCVDRAIHHHSQPSSSRCTVTKKNAN